ncbi:MAG: type II secretion system protein GspM [Novosphingobium meiothermophilum]
MMQRISAWFLGLTARERMLVSLAAALAGVILLVYGLVLPLGHALDEAAVRHRLATEQAGRMATGLALLKRAPAAAAPTLAGPVDQAANAAAQEAGFVVQSSQRQGDDAAVLVIPSARPAAALVWLDGLAAKGLAVDQVTMTPAPDGSVAINLTLRRGGVQ